MPAFRRIAIPSFAVKVFDGELFEVFQWQASQFDGSTYTFEMARRPDNVVVLAIRADDKLLVTLQEQPGISEKFYDYPGGRVESGESPLDAASREFMEETGHRAAGLCLIFAFQPSDRVDSVTYVYRCLAPKRVAGPAPDPGERIQIGWLDFDKVRELAVYHHRLAITPVLLAASIGELRTRNWLKS